LNEPLKEMVNDAVENSLVDVLRPTAVMVVSDGAATDDELAAAVIGGDERSYEILFQRHRRAVAGVIGNIFRETTDIEEIIQQAFTKAYFSLSKFRGGECSFKTWLIRIAINTSYDELRRRKRRSERLFTEMSEEETAYVDSLNDDSAPRADNSLIARQLADKLLSTLSPEDRIAVVMVYSEQCSLDDAASAIGISTSSLKSRLFRFRSTVKTRFGHLFR
jgi:RNA polymerase sigma-70 factor (ECF subfamily)